MSDHRARIRWDHEGESFARGRYSRAHRWTFDGGVTVAASGSPDHVPKPYADPSAVDPEEAFVASIASCHMLVFLWLASKDGYDVVRYEDDAVGRMTPNERGALWVSEVVLAPRITYGEGRVPDAADEADLHHRTHEQCFIANSVRTEIRVEPPPPR